MEGMSVLEGISIAVGVGIVSALVQTVMQAKVNAIHANYTALTLERHGKEIRRLDDKIDKEVGHIHGRIDGLNK